MNKNRSGMFKNTWAAIEKFQEEEEMKKETKNPGFKDEKLSDLYLNNCKETNDLKEENNNLKSKINNLEKELGMLKRIVVRQHGVTEIFLSKWQ